MATLERVRKKQIELMRKTCDTLGNILAKVSQETATTLRDGPDGWTILEIVCHLRDFDGFFYRRVRMIMNQDHPPLPAFDHEALAIERAYNQQNLAQAYADLRESRQSFIEYFESLESNQWERAGIHPEQGRFTLTDAAMQVGNHDANHIEQITRILLQENVKVERVVEVIKPLEPPVSVRATKPRIKIAKPR